MLNLCYVYYLSKLTEFADTIFFVLRKKKSQMTWLHLYHHSLTPLEAWILVKFLAGKQSSVNSSAFAVTESNYFIFLAGGNATFPNIINNFVHICMYFYYMMSAMGPQYQKYLWWKKYMTELQIVSFCISILCNGHLNKTKKCYNFRNLSYWLRNSRYSPHHKSESFLFLSKLKDNWFIQMVNIVFSNESSKLIGNQYKRGTIVWKQNLVYLKCVV